VLANDTDSSGTINPASVAISTGAAHGTTSVNPATGAVTYTPANGFVGTDTFKYTVADTIGDVSAPASVSVSVEAPTSPPVINGVMTLSSSDTDVTVSDNNISIQATAGSRVMLINGTNDTVNVNGGTNNITDSGGHNTFVLPPAGQGLDDISGDVFAKADTLDLRPALAATAWSGSSPIEHYVQVIMSGNDAEVMVSGKSNGSGTLIADLRGVGTTDLQRLLAHSIL
jgi:hypothetical protein